MRGPGYKLTGDVRRTWRCPHCARERKLQGDVTSLMCGCQEGAWMQIVVERTSAPRPLQRPSDLERRPIDFGIEPSPPAPAKPESTIIKPAISREPDPISDSIGIGSETVNAVENDARPQDTNDGRPQGDGRPEDQNAHRPEDEEDWGEGIL